MYCAARRQPREWRSALDVVQAAPVAGTHRGEGQNMQTEVPAAPATEGQPGVAATPLLTGRAVRVVLGVVAALVIGLVVGAVTERHPSDVIPASTAGGPWVFLSFLVALTAGRIATATARGMACMTGLAIGYYGAASLQGFELSTGTAGFWIPLALVIGPLTGLAAGWVRSGPPLLAQIGAGGVPGTLLSEGFAASHDLELLAGAVLLAALLAWQVHRAAAHAPAPLAAVRAGAVTLAACLATGALTASWYIGFVGY
jgi:hypothetical protein